MDNSFITVGSFQFVYEAQAAELHLASEGIECHLDGLNTVNMDWGLSNAIGNIRVQTRASDATRAREILHRMNHKVSKIDQTDSCLACGVPMSESTEVCEECGWSFATEPEGMTEESPAPSDVVEVFTEPEILNTTEPGALEDMRSFAKTMISGYLIYLAFFGICAVIAILYSIFSIM